MKDHERRSAQSRAPKAATPARADSISVQRASLQADVASLTSNRILNPHITYFDLNGFVINPGTQAERDSAISLPTA